MSTTDFIPNQDSKLTIFLENFFQVCSSNTGLLSLTAAELAEIENAKNGFVLGLQNLEAAKAAQLGATQQKDMRRRTAVAIVRKFAREFKGNPNMSEALLAQLGVIKHTRSGPVVPVTNVTVLGYSDGVNEISFNRNGNAYGTTFVIESSETSAGPWSLSGVVTKTRFKHEGNIPGEERFYRIVSIRASQSSAPTPPVIVYPGGDSESRMSIAA